MRPDGARVQAEAAELSRSRCPDCCQRLGVGEEPEDGDRVAGQERRLREAGRLQEQEAGVEATGQRDAQRSGLGGSESSTR